VLARWGTRLVASLVGIAVGILLADALLADFSASVGAIVAATIVFWVVHLLVDFLALRVLIRNPSIAVAGLLALASTIVSLVIVNIVVSGLKINGASTYVFATLIIWVTTAISVVVGGRRIREQR
jgi:putative membrane protein